MTSRKLLADKLAKRLAKARTEVQKTMLAAQVLTCAEGDEACLQMATTLNWLDSAITELGRVDPRVEVT